MNVIKKEISEMHENQILTLVDRSKNFNNEDSNIIAARQVLTIKEEINRKKSHKSRSLSVGVSNTVGLAVNKTCERTRKFSEAWNEFE